MNIQLDASATPLCFRFSSDDGTPIKLSEVRITEVGEAEPSWWLVHHDPWVEEAVEMGIISASEARRASVVVTRRLGNDPEKLVPDIGVPVTELRYGQVPLGLRQQGSLKELKSNRLYELMAMGSTVGELQFYG
jgi:hypothetical protein